MKLPSFKFSPTPGQRFAFAFFIGFAFELACQLLGISVREDAWLTASICLALAVGLIYIYATNKVKFEREMTWMTIKNPQQLTADEIEIVHRVKGYSAPVNPPRKK